MPITLADSDLNERIDSLRTGYEGYASELRTRNQAYLRYFSPVFDPDLGEHDQWSEPIKASAAGKARNSYNLARAVAELWTALEAYPLPTIRFVEPYVPSVVPDLDPEENSRRVETQKAVKLMARRITTMREHVLGEHLRRSRVKRHYYRAALRKNVFGHAWLRCLPDTERGRFDFTSSYDPSTVYPVWSAWDENELAAILVVTRKSARQMHEQYPDAVKTERDGEHVEETSYYNPTNRSSFDTDRGWVWVEDYWLLDREFEEPVSDDEPVRSRVICAQRVNGKIVRTEEYKGWRALPYFYLANDNLRDHLGASDVGSVMAINDGFNRFVSQQADVIAGESRPKFKFRGDSGRKIELSDDGIISLDTDEDVEQLAVNVNVFPTQVHGQQLTELLARVTGLNDSVWGRIVASQNSGRALATAWRSVAARLVPRLFDNEETIDRVVTFMLDILELYDWDTASELYNGNRDFEIEFPNQEPRDFMETAAVAINKLNAGLQDQVAAMEETGETSPDEMVERVRGDYVDPVLHPEKSQSYLLLEQLKQQIDITNQQAQLAAASAQQQLAAQAATPPGGAPGGPAPSAAAAEQARTQAAQEAAPTNAPGVGPGPATQAGAAANPSQTRVSTLVQNGGPAQNRIIRQTVLP